MLDASTPSCWVVGPTSSQSFNLGPQAWQGAGFWESFFDGDPAALTLYDEFRSSLPQDPDVNVLPEYATVKTVQPLPGSDLPIGSIGVVLGVIHEPDLNYKLEIVDDSGEEVFSGRVGPEMVEELTSDTPD